MVFCNQDESGAPADADRAVVNRAAKRPGPLGVHPSRMVSRAMQEWTR